MQEVLARGGRVIGVATRGEKTLDALEVKRIDMPACLQELYPILAVIPLQLLAYYVADFKGTDVDQPRNLAKTVTVE